MTLHFLLRRRLFNQPQIALLLPVLYLLYIQSLQHIPPVSGCCPGLRESACDIMARRGRRPGTSRAVTAAVTTVATTRAIRRRNTPPTSSTVPILESLTPPATLLLDHGSSFVSDEDIESIAHLSSDTAADTETDSSSGIDLYREWEGKQDTPPASEADAILKRIAHHRKQGPAKPRHSDRTKELWKMESKFWERQAPKRLLI